jgi:hypothetical protein
MKKLTFCFITPMNGAVVLLIFLFGSCGGIKIDSTQSKGVDLAKYKTYAWVKPHDPDHESRNDDKLYSKLILELANAELLKKGFVLDTLQPEAIFLFDARVDKRINYSKGPGFGGSGYYYVPVSTSPTHRAYEEGMLYIDMLDAKTKVPLWGGWATTELTEKSDVEKDIRTAVKSIFTRLKVTHK